MLEIIVRWLHYMQISIINKFFSYLKKWTIEMLRFASIFNENCFLPVNLLCCLL